MKRTESVCRRARPRAPGKKSGRESHVSKVHVGVARLLSSCCLIIAAVLVQQEGVGAQQQQRRSPPAAKVEEGGRRIFVGTIGDNYGVRVALDRRGRRLVGSYYHESDRLTYRDETGVLFLSGSVDRSGAVTLVERDAPSGVRGGRARQTATLKARLTRTSGETPPRWQLIGTWLRTGGGGKSVMFEWKEERFDLGPTLRLTASQPIAAPIAGTSAANFVIAARAPQLIGEAGGGDAASATARRFNEAVQTIVGERIGKFTAESSGGARSGTSAGELAIEGEVTYADARMISVRFVGRAEGRKNWRSVDVLNFDLRRGKTIGLAELFDEEAAYRELFAEQSARSFRRSPYRGVVDTSPAAPAFGRWNVTSKAIVFTFDAAAAPGGTVEAAIPTDMFASMLGADGPLGLRRRAPKFAPPKPLPDRPVAADDEAAATNRAAATTGNVNWK